eukprot:TRINITY_DN5320_c0_g1_i1.p1 TRINITY_DN5320_c0_g1~~TRINITY_DN5320_c0_g1_i1.p1  ORF type:complete len:784 (-),score=164.92 TRINITY_DN5320_c0_g1_i1:187-2538(-)
MPRGNVMIAGEDAQDAADIAAAALVEAEEEQEQKEAAHHHIDEEPEVYSTDDSLESWELGDLQEEEKAAKLKQKEDRHRAREKAAQQAARQEKDRQREEALGRSGTWSSSMHRKSSVLAGVDVPRYTSSLSDIQDYAEGPDSAVGMEQEEEEEEDEESDENWKEVMAAFAGEGGDVPGVDGGRKCCGCSKERRKRFRQRRKACRKRYDKLCGPCSRVVQFFDRTWLMFNDSLRPLAFFIKCVLCPLFLVLRCLVCCLGLKRHKPAQSKRVEQLIAKALNHGLSPGREPPAEELPLPPTTEHAVPAIADQPASFQRSTSSGSRPNSPTSGFRSSRSGTTSFAGSVESSYSGGSGPKKHGRSKLKPPKPRMRKDQIIGKPKGQSALTERERFRLALKGTDQPDDGAGADIVPQDHDKVPLVFRLGWKAWLPWNLEDTYQVWLYSRKEFWAKLDGVMSTIEEEEEFDFQNLDAFGMPKRRHHNTPLWLRRYWRVLIFAYWEPVIDLLPSVKKFFMVLRWLILLAPVCLFGAAGGWLLFSATYNMQFLDGECQIEKLPETFKTKKGIVTTVTGRYQVRRFYAPSPTETEGYVLSYCDVTVECKNEDLGRGDTAEDDRCDSFQMWAWQDSIECFYHQDDYFGDGGTELYCLGRPSNLQQEMFSFAVAGIILFVSLIVACLILYRSSIDRRHAREVQEELERAKQQRAKDLEEQTKQEEAEAARQAAKQKLEMLEMARETEHHDDEDDDGHDLEHGHEHGREQDQQHGHQHSKRSSQKSIPALDMKPAR